MLLTDVQGKLINWIIRELDPTAIAAENDEVDSVGGGEVIDKSAKSKNIKKIVKGQKFAKARRLEQATFLSSEASSVFFTEDDSDWYLLATIEAFQELEAPPGRLIVQSFHPLWFMTTKSLSFRQVRWAQELSLSLGIIFQSALVRTKQMERQTRRFASHREALMRKKSFNLSGLNRSEASLSHFHQILICETHVLPATSILGLFSDPS